MKFLIVIIAMIALVASQGVDEFNNCTTKNCPIFKVCIYNVCQHKKACKLGCDDNQYCDEDLCHDRPLWPCKLGCQHYQRCDRDGYCTSGQACVLGCFPDEHCENGNCVYNNQPSQD